jgi:TonB family protein
MPAGPSLTWELPLAAFAHAVMFAIVAVARCSSGESEPLFKPQDTIQVALAGPPKNVTRMPQKAERAPDAPKASAPDVKAPPPPPNASDMAFKTPDAPKTNGNPDAAAEMQKKLDELRRKQALQDLSAPLGKEDRAASSPDGSAEGGDQSSLGVNDPELARWQRKARDLVGKNWHPLPQICAANPGLATLVRVSIDAGGQQVEAAEVVQKSGNFSFDEAAKRAVEATPSLPALPEKYKDGLYATLRFTGKECQ